MGRAREFDTTEVLSKAMYLFWRNGYASTSLKEILDAMGIQNGSFYHSYGSKRQLYIEAMQFYQEDFAKKRTALFRSSRFEFGKKLRILFKHILDRQEESVCPKGCFLFNSVTPEIVGDLELFKLVRRGIASFEDFLRSEMTLAVGRGELDPVVDPAVTASVLVTYAQGLMNLSVLDYDDVKFKQQTEHFLKSLGL